MAYLAYARPTRRTAQLEVYLPNRDRHGAVVPYGLLQSYIDRVTAAVCALPGGGGCSSYQVEGRWGETVEDTLVIRATVLLAPNGDPRIFEGSDALVDVLAQYRDATSREAVGLTLDGRWLFVQGEVAL
jgi:hypothetical protein